MSDPDVSVVTPTFHREREVVACVRSALGQRGPTLEVLVVDDSAESSARDVVAGIGDPRVRFLACDEPSGGRPARVRQRALALARGRFVHFLDDDDQLVDGALEALVCALERAPHAGVALGRIVPFGSNEASLARETAYFARAAKRGRGAHGRFELAACLLFKEAPLVCSACIVRRAVASEIGWDATLAYCEDADFYLRAIRGYGFVFVDRPVVHYRTGAPSLMGTARERPDDLRAAYRSIYEKYRRAHGRAELWALRALAALE